MRAEPMRVFSEYGEIYPPNLWVFTPLATLTPQPCLPQPLPKNLVIIHYKTWYDDQAA